MQGVFQINRQTLLAQNIQLSRMISKSRSWPTIKKAESRHLKIAGAGETELGDFRFPMATKRRCFSASCGRAPGMEALPDGGTSTVHPRPCPTWVYLFRTDGNLNPFFGPRIDTAEIS